MHCTTFSLSSLRSLLPYSHLQGHSQRIGANREELCQVLALRRRLSSPSTLPGWLGIQSAKSALRAGTERSRMVSRAARSKYVLAVMQSDVLIKLFCSRHRSIILQRTTANHSGARRGRRRTADRTKRAAARRQQPEPTSSTGSATATTTAKRTTPAVPTFAAGCSTRWQIKQ